MPVLSPKAVTAAAYLGGFRGGDDLTLMVAIAGAESSFNTDAGPNSVCNCRGLWQINLDVHTCADALKPVNNAKCAKRIRGSQGLKAWEGYTNGAYKRHLGAAAQGYQQWLAEVKQRGANEGVDDRSEKILQEAGGDTTGSPGGLIPNPLDAVADTAGAITGAIAAVAEFANRIGAWVSEPRNWLRVAGVLAGGALVIASAGIIARPAELPAVDLARKAIP
jgi:hypothetical protein